LSGNIWVAIFSTLVIILVWMSEERSLQLLHIQKKSFDFYQAFWIFSCYSIFAFLITICRELIKDAQDIKGDKIIHAQTYPILNGIPATKKLLILLHIALISLIFIVLYLFSSSISTLQLCYSVVFISLPIVLSIYLIYKAILPRSFGIISTLIKCIMVTGTLFLLSFPI
jgi:4-hydroxybenzoate polyprenyltransferase